MECDGHFPPHLLESRASSPASPRECADASQGPQGTPGQHCHSILEFPAQGCTGSEQAGMGLQNWACGWYQSVRNAKEEAFLLENPGLPPSILLADFLGQQQQRRKARRAGQDHHSRLV